MTAQPALPTPRRRLFALPAGDGLLRGALQLDAVVSAANGVAYLALAGPLADLLGPSVGSLRAVGAFLVLYGAPVWVVGRRARLRRTAVDAVIGENTLWVLASLTLASAWSDLTTVGAVWTVLQATSVALFAALQAVGRRRLP